jgi:2-isopropylmalate synthase
MRRATGWEQPWFRVDSFQVTTVDVIVPPDPGATPDITTEATIQLVVDGEEVVATARGNGPINALDTALRQAIVSKFPALDRLHLTDYKVRVLDTQKGTGAMTRVLLDTTNGDRSWTTIGVSENIIEASWQALVDALVYGLVLAQGTA